jgi:hypothetical protein
MRKSVMLIVGATVMILAGAAAQPARADAKSNFKQGCESGHGSYVENAENVQCNSSGGTTITCDYNITKCTASRKGKVTTIKPTSKTLRAYMR